MRASAGSLRAAVVTTPQCWPLGRFQMLVERHPNSLVHRMQFLALPGRALDRGTVPP